MPVQTLVFFDLETTGIPANSAKVTEITLLSVSRSDIEQADGKNLPPISKLSLLCNPQKHIQPAAAKLTGLTNTFLKNQPIFKDTIQCINSFLDKPKPVCLVAHNGNRFDFKILLAEYREANECLPQDLVCIDSLNVFRNILQETKNCSIDNVINSFASLDVRDGIVQNEEGWSDLSCEEIQEIDELVDQISNLISTPKKLKRETKVKNPPKEPKVKNVSYTLCNIYERLLNKKVMECHRAEADCIMLLECVVATKKEFLAYTDSKIKPLSQINS